MLKIKKILVPCDFSEESELAVEWAVRLAKEEKEATIYLLHVITPIPIVPEAGFDMSELIAAQFKNAKKNLEDWQQKITPPLTSIVFCREGDLAGEVVYLCGKEKIDLVVMTTHGRQGLTRIVHPNLSEKIVRTAPCPVLVLHLNPRTEEAVKSVS